MLRQYSPYRPACNCPRTRQGRAITPWCPATRRRLSKGAAIIASWLGGHHLGKRVIRHSMYATAVGGCRVDTECSCTSCNEVHRLLHEYDAAVVRLLQALEHDGSSPVERERRERIAKEAREICGTTMAAFQMQLGRCLWSMEAAPAPPRRARFSFARRS